MADTTQVTLAPGVLFVPYGGRVVHEVDRKVDRGWRLLCGDIYHPWARGHGPDGHPPCKACERARQRAAEREERKRTPGPAPLLEPLEGGQ